MTLVIFCILFFIWNFGVGSFLVDTISKICREGVNRENRAEICCRIIIPHQWIGIIIPLLASMSWSSSLHEKIAIITITIVIPYSFWTIVQITQCFDCSWSLAIPNERETHARQEDEEQQQQRQLRRQRLQLQERLRLQQLQQLQQRQLRPLQQLRRERQQLQQRQQQHNNHEDDEEDRKEEEVEQLEDTRIIYKKVVQGESRLQSHHDNCSFRSKHPKSDIVVYTRKTFKGTSQSNIGLEDELSQRSTKNGQQFFYEESSRGVRTG